MASKETFEELTDLEFGKVLLGLISTHIPSSMIADKSMVLLTTEVKRRFPDKKDRSIMNHQTEAQCDTCSKIIEKRSVHIVENITTTIVVPPHLCRSERV